MPTVTMAVCIPQDQWQQALTAQQLPGSFSQVYSLRDVLAGGLAALGQQDRCTLNGWLTAQVVQVGNVQTGYQACDGASSRCESNCDMLFEVHTADHNMREVLFCAATNHMLPGHWGRACWYADNRLLHALLSCTYERPRVSPGPVLLLSALLGMREGSSHMLPC